MILATAWLVGHTEPAAALTADDVLNNMTADERVAHIAGVIGGLAYARFLRDRPDETGMACVYDWYYARETERQDQINAWFERHLDKPVEPLLYVLIKEDCGE